MRCRRRRRRRSPTTGTSGQPILGTDDSREAVAAGPEEARREVLAPLLEGRIGVADRAVVADVGRDEASFGRPAWMARHASVPTSDPARAPARPRSRWCQDRRLRGPCWRASEATLNGSGGSPPGVPRGRHRRHCRTAARGSCCATFFASPQLPTVPSGEADAVRVHVDLNDRCILGPVVDAVARQRRERVEAGAQRQHHVRLGDELHRGFGAVVAEGPDGERVRGPGKLSLCW